MKKFALIFSGCLVSISAIAHEIIRDTNLYYGQQNVFATVQSQGRPTGDHYRNFKGCDGSDCDVPVPSPVRAQVASEPPRNPTAPSRGMITREHITNPFWQPKQGRFYSFTDLGYMSERIDTAVSLGGPFVSPANENWYFSNDVLHVSQSLGVGLTDEVVLVGGIRYVSGEQKMPEALIGSGEESKIDVYAIDLRWMFVDNHDWVGFIQGGYLNYADLANVFGGQLQVGYKNDDTVLYVFGRVQYYNWNYPGQGFGVENQSGQRIAFEVANDLSNTINFEIGAGAFMAFSNEWAADIGVAMADLDFYRQVYGLAKLNYQPWDNAAVSFYGRLALWDNMDSLTDLNIWARGAFATSGGGTVTHNDPVLIGSGSVTGSSSFAVGAQLTLLF